MTERWQRGWVRWLAGFVFGVVLGLGFWVVGLVAVVIALVAAGLTVLRRWSLTFLSGWVTGVGALWLGLMVRVRLSCAADPSCVVSSGTEGFTLISLGILLVGVLIGILAWRRRQVGSTPSA